MYVQEGKRSGHSEVCNSFTWRLSSFLLFPSSPPLSLSLSAAALEKKFGQAPIDGRRGESKPQRLIHFGAPLLPCGPIGRKRRLICPT